jgi:hypothetical protein
MMALAWQVQSLLQEVREVPVASCSHGYCGAHAPLFRNLLGSSDYQPYVFLFSYETLGRLVQLSVIEP